MLVSVIMPVYNASDYLKEAIQSLLEQSYTDWELIAVDDGSTDNSVEVIQSFTDPRIKVFQRSNGGQSAATNTGLKYINGEYVQFFDADDLMDKYKIEIQVKALQAAGNNGVSVCKWAFFNKSIKDAKFKEEPIYYSGKPTDWLYSLWANETMMPNHGYLIPRTVLEKAGKYYDEAIQLNIDFEYFTRMVLEADAVVFCPEAICYYRKGVTSSKTYKPVITKQLSALAAREKALTKFLLLHNDENSREAARMALTILTFSFPSIRKHSKQVLKDLGLERFGFFGGRRFKQLASFVGFENALRIKELYQRVR
jgi:glycosyltransferase involved in cell wall biosynthesis